MEVGLILEGDYYSVATIKGDRVLRILEAYIYASLLDREPVNLYGADEKPYFITIPRSGGTHLILIFPGFRNQVFGSGAGGAELAYHIFVFSIDQQGQIKSLVAPGNWSPGLISYDADFTLLPPGKNYDFGFIYPLHDDERDFDRTIADKLKAKAYSESLLS
jgi:hypothetical protein